MNTKTLKRSARNWKHELQDQIGGRDGGSDTALLAWQILGGLVVLTAIYGVVSMMPEMVRYMNIKRM